MSVIHKILPVGALACNCSILGNSVTGDAIVVDPGDNVADILKVLEEHKLKVSSILITHAHIDHVGGAMRLKARTGAPILMNEHDRRLLGALEMQAAWIGLPPPEPVVIDAGLADGARVGDGSLAAQVIHTPGHTEGSVCLLMESMGTLLAGDTLFAGSIGRTDLPGGSFDKIMDSLHGRLMQLPDDTRVVPGHGRLTTIGDERQTNPFLSRKGFI
jgi:hydroxyacylglutathione hydrolase